MYRQHTHTYTASAPTVLHVFTCFQRLNAQQVLVKSSYTNMSTRAPSAHIAAAMLFSALAALHAHTRAHADRSIVGGTTCPHYNSNALLGHTAQQTWS